MSYKLKSRWLSSAKYPRKSPYAMRPAGIVVHNTAGDASATEEAAAMVGNSSAVSFHVVIDEEYAVECIPFSRNAFHAGDGAQGYANRNLIGIEIARSAEESGDRFRRAEENAALYIAHVCVQYGWTSAQLHQHNWYSATECPHRTKTHWSEFLAKVDENIATIKASSEDHPAPSVPQVTLIALGKALDVPAENRNGTVYAPVRALCEALGFDVEWKDGEVMIA